MLKIIIICLISYLLGSLNFALIISKYFFKIDLTKYGSGNLGATNTSRVLGKKIAFIVLILDLTKVFLAFYLAYLIDSQVYYLSGLCAAIGHCYPIFNKFNGGKAVATLLAFIIASAMINQDIYLILISFITFIFVLKMSKIVALASITAASLTLIYVISTYPKNYALTFSLIVALLIYRHKSNINQLLKNKD